MASWSSPMLVCYWYLDRRRLFLVDNVVRSLGDAKAVQQKNQLTEVIKPCNKSITYENSEELKTCVALNIRCSKHVSIMIATFVMQALRAFLTACKS